MLQLNSNTVGDEGARVIADILKQNTSVTTLDPSNNSIGDEGWKALLAAVSLNAAIQNVAFDVACGLEGRLRLHSECLELNCSGLGDRELAAVMEMLKHNTCCGSAFNRRGHSMVGKTLAMTLSRSALINASMPWSQVCNR